MPGPRAVRSLVALRRLPPAPPDTLIRAVDDGAAGGDRSWPPTGCCEPVRQRRAAAGRRSPTASPATSGRTTATSTARWRRPSGCSRLRAAGRSPWVADRRPLPARRAVPARSSRATRPCGHLRRRCRCWTSSARPDAIGLRWAMVLGQPAARRRRRGGALAGADGGRRSRTTCGDRTCSSSRSAPRSCSPGARSTPACGCGGGPSTGCRDTDCRWPGGEPGLEPWALEVQAVDRGRPRPARPARPGRRTIVDELAAAAVAAAHRVRSPTAAVSSSELPALRCAPAGPRHGGSRPRRAHRRQPAARSGVRLIALAERFRFLRQLPADHVAGAGPAGRRAGRPAGVRRRGVVVRRPGPRRAAGRRLAALRDAGSAAGRVAVEQRSSPRGSRPGEADAPGDGERRRCCRSGCPAAGRAGSR